MSVSTTIENIKSIIDFIYKRQLDNSIGPDPSDNELSIIFNGAWTIIDRVHTLHEVLKERLSLIEKEKVANFIELAGVASSLRNKMDHIHGQVQNMARKTKKPSAPIFGAVSAMMLDKAQVDRGEIAYIDVIVLSHSEFHHKVNFKTVPDEIFPISGPVDHVRLHAFDEIIDLTKLSQEAVKLTNILEVRRENPPGSDRRLKVVCRVTFDTPVR